MWLEAFHNTYPLFHILSSISPPLLFFLLFFVFALQLQSLSFSQV